MMVISSAAETRECLEKGKKNDAMKEFTCLDCMLLASGCKIFISNAAVRFANNLLLIIMVLTYAVEFYCSYSEAKERSAFTALIKFCDCCDEVAGLLFIVIINRNRLTFTKRMTAMMQTMNEDQRHALSRLSFWCMIALLFTLIEDLLLTMIHLTIGRFWGKTWHVVSDIISSFTLFNSWFLGGCFVYAFCVTMIRFSEENYFKQLGDKVNCNRESGLRLACERKKLTQRRKKLLDSFSFIPLLWFVYAFIKSTVMFIEIIERYPHVVGLHLASPAARAGNHCTVVRRLPL